MFFRRTSAEMGFFNAGFQFFDFQDRKNINSNIINFMYYYAISSQAYVNNMLIDLIG